MHEGSLAQTLQHPAESWFSKTLVVSCAALSAVSQCRFAFHLVNVVAQTQYAIFVVLEFVLRNCVWVAYTLAVAHFLRFRNRCSQCCRTNSRLKFPRLGVFISLSLFVSFGAVLCHKFEIKLSSFWSLLVVMGCVHHSGGPEAVTLRE